MDGTWTLPSCRALRHVAFGLAVLVGLAACSSDADDAAVTTAPIVTASPAAASTTTAPPPTNPGDLGVSASTAVSSTAPPATAAPTTAATTVPPTTQPPSVIDVSVLPGTGTDAFVGARADVTGESCAANGTDFVSGGTVTNPTKKVAAYRIYSALVRPDGSTAAVIEADVKAVRAGKSAEFASTLPNAAGPFQCVLRVERSGG